MKSRGWGKARGGRIFRRLVSDQKLECGHSAVGRDKVQRCSSCEDARRYGPAIVLPKKG